MSCLWVDGRGNGSKKPRSPQLCHYLFPWISRHGTEFERPFRLRPRQKAARASKLGRGKCVSDPGSRAALRPAPSLAHLRLARGSLTPLPRPSSEIAMRFASTKNDYEGAK